MYNKNAQIARAKELQVEVDRVTKNPTLTPDQKTAFFKKVNAEIEEMDAQRNTHEKALQLRGSGDLGGPGGAVGCKAAPLFFGAESVQAMHQAVRSRQSMQMETKSFNSVDSHLPAQLAPNILGTIHENRILDRLPAQAISAPSYEYIRHTATTGSPAVVAEGAQKPELVFTIDHVIATPAKVACHAAISWESLQDYDTFTRYLQSEMTRQVIDTENSELLNGSGSGGHMTGLLNTSGILTHTVSSETSLDAVEISIAALRTGSSLAEANLLVLHPATWSAMRRTKDSQNRYLVNPDPTADAVNKLWGVEVLTTTVIAAGTGLLADTMKFGRVLVREALSIRTGSDGSDFTHNLVRFVCEERLVPAVERPSALLAISGLPTS